MKLSTLTHAITNHALARMIQRKIKPAVADVVAEVGLIVKVDPVRRSIKKVVSVEQIPYLQRMLFQWEGLDSQSVDCSEKLKKLIKVRISGISKLIGILQLRKQITVILHNRNVLTVY